MIYIDFGIICIEQTKKTFPKNVKNLKFEVYRRTEKSDAMYNEWYHFHTADMLTGNWYLVWRKDDISHFDIPDDKDCTYGPPPVCVEPASKDVVRKLLEFYIEKSPIHRIAVLLRLQDESDDVSHPVCTLDEFMNDLAEGNIRSNELYFIEHYM